MADIFVGTSSAGAANGTSWANRYGTLNAAEDKPVVAGDRVIVGPGVYRELLTVDVSGSSGNAIEYLADVTGRLTDGVGGVVRITGSDNDLVASRANCITATSKDYRTFTGFAFDVTTSHLISMITACSNWIIQDCYFAGLTAGVNGINMAGTGTSNTIRRSKFVGSKNMGIAITHSATVSNSAHLIENCQFIACVASSVRITRVGGITIKGCAFFGGAVPIRVDTALAAGQTTTVNNNIIAWATTNGVQAVTVPATNEEITENYNAFYGNIAARSNVSTGANSLTDTNAPLFNPHLLLSGYQLPNLPLSGLSQWSSLRAMAGTSMSSEDIFGITRPVTDSKKSWGPVQFTNVERDTGTVHTGSTSLKEADATAFQFPVPVGNGSMTISCYVQWETDYAGTKPQMIIKQAGQADITVTATGSSGAWELLSNIFTPASSPDFVMVELRSNNTATSGNYDVFFDQLMATNPPSSFESWVTNRMPFGVIAPPGLAIHGGSIVR